MRRLQWFTLVSWLLAFSVACSSSNGGDSSAGGADGSNGNSDAGSGGTDGADGDGSVGDGSLGDGSGGDSGVERGLVVSPTDLQTLEVDLRDDTPPTVTYQARFDGQPVLAGWNVDRGELGNIGAGPSSSAVFTPSATLGGMVTVRAGLNGVVVERRVFIKVKASQNGPNPGSSAEQGQVAPDVPSLTAGGGIGGVGGEGLGVAVDDPTTRDALDTPIGDGSAEGLKLLYPYDGTVWPRGLLAPLLMWESTLGSVDAVKIDLSTESGAFSWSGRFGAPAILASTGSNFVRHPIPQDAWAAATDSAGGQTPDGSLDRVKVSLTVAKDGKAYGPITQTWTIAPARLSGTIYYSSYGTNLAKNFDGAKGGDGKFGGAVLSIRVGDSGPKLAAGTDGNASNCRVCHSVSADGSRLFALSGDNYRGLSSDLTPAGATNEQEIPPRGVEYPGLTSNGSFALGPTAALYDLTMNGAAVATTGLNPDVATAIGPASFSYDGKKVAFNPMAGPIVNGRRKILTMDFDAATKTFANPVTVVDNSAESNTAVRPGWPTFTPDGAIVYHQQIVASNEGDNDGALHTRRGAKAYLAWTKGDGTVAPLHALNGLQADGTTSYLPRLAAPVNLACSADNTQVGSISADHADDQNLNYEPTVNPVASGGYAWVVFTSRRMYGNVAAIPPFCSDPRGVDLITNITTKKLWVAAIKLNGTPGEDISAPAFYLPAQELLAGNTRGAWVLDPCRADGDSCATGDQCCNGYCTASGEGGALVCANDPPDRECSLAQEKCETSADCCDDQLECLNGFCSQVVVIQ